MRTPNPFTALSPLGDRIRSVEARLHGNLLHDLGFGHPLPFPFYICVVNTAVSRSRDLLFQPVVMLQTCQNGTRYHPQMLRKPMPMGLPRNRQGRD
jgi:hypothetical protein